MGSIISWLVAGIVVGLLAKLVVPGRQNIRWWLTLLIGLVGAGAGTLIATRLGVDHTAGIDWVKHILQVGIAAVLVWIVVAVTGRGKAAPQVPRS